VLDLIEQDFKDISNVTDRLFEIGVHRFDDHLSTVVCPNSEFLKQDLKGKHSWFNASCAKDSSERVKHVLSACATNPLSTSVCVTHEAVNVYRHVFVEGFLLCFDCAKRGPCPPAARGRLLVSCAKS
jgi:hypothetical protein